MPNETRKWLYDQLSSKGVNLGSYEQYDKAYDNDEYVKWFYDTAVKSGFNMGSYEQFVGAVKTKEPPVDTSMQIVQEEGVQQDSSDKPTDAKRRAFHNKMMGVSTYADRPQETESVQPDYGFRNDGTKKGKGWLGEIKLPNGGVATEYSIGVNLGEGEMEIPTLVPTLTEEEVALMRDDIIPNNKRVPQEILDKAVAHARQMLAEGKSVWSDAPQETEPAPASKSESKPFEPLNLPYNGEFQPEQTEQVNVPEAPANAEQMQADYERKREISRYAPGWQEGKPYSIDEAIEIGKRTDTISPLVNTYKDKVEEISAKYKDFLDSLEKTEDGKFKLKTRDDEKKFNEYISEIKPYIDARSEFDEMLKTPAGQEFTALWGKLTPLMAEQEEEPNAERALEITMIQAELAKNPIYRSLAGKDAPTESQIQFNILSAEKDVWKEREEQAINGSYRREIRGKLDAIKAEMLDNRYFQEKVQKDIVNIEKELGELDQKLEPVREQMRRSKTGVAVVKDLPEGYENDANRAQELRQALTKLQHIRDKNTSDFFVNMGDVFSDANFLTQGVYGLRTLINAKLAEKSPEAEGAKALLEAIVKRQEAEQTEGEFVNWVGRAGQQTANMIPFVASIGLVNGWSSVAKAVGGSAEKWLYSKLTKEAAEKLGNRFLIHTLGTTLGDITAGIVSANTIGLGNTAHNIAERYFGHLVRNEDGSYSFQDGENFLAAFAKGEVSGSLEYWSERFGDHLQHLLGQGVLRFAASRPGIHKMAEFIGKSLDTDWTDIGLSKIETNGALSTLEKVVKHSSELANRFGIQGYPFEVIEEEVNILGNIIFQTGDNSWKDFRLDSETQVDIWGGMLFSIGSMQAVSLATSGIAEGLNAYANNKTYKMLESNLGALASAGAAALGEEKWADIQYEVDNASNKDLPAIIQRVANSGEYSPAEREYIKRYVEQTYIYRGFNQGTLEFAKARILGDKSLRSLNINETVSFAETEIGDAYMLGFQSKDSDDAKINISLETQRQRISQMFGVEDMSREQAMGIINNSESTDEQRDAALDYLMALASADGVVDRKKAQHNARLAVEDAKLISQFGGHQVSRQGPNGERIAETAFIDGPNGEPMQIFVIGNEGTSKGTFPAVARDGKVYMVGRGAVYSIDENGNKIIGQTSVTDYNQYLEDRVSISEAQEAEQKQQAMDAEEHSETLATLVGKSVYIAGEGAYSPMRIERITQNGQSVVISGDKDALKGVAQSAGIAFPGGSMLEIPIENLYPLLAKDDDGTLSIGDEKGQAIPVTESEDSLKDLVGEEVQIMQNGTPITVRVNKVENGKVQYITDGTGGALVGRYMPVEEFMKAMQGTETPAPAQPVAPVAQPQPAPNPEPAPVVEPEPQPTPAEEKKTIPVDEKSGEPIYDHPDVEPVQAYDDIYGKLSQKNADKFVIGQYDAAQKNLEEAQRVVDEGEEEKARIDEWEIKAGEGVNAFQKRVASAKAKVDERIAKAQADLLELQRKVDFWNQLRVVAQDNIRQREAELKLDMEPRDISELIAQELNGLFRSGKKLYLPSVLAFVGEDKRKELLKKYPGCFTDDASNSITLDDWATNVLAGSENGNMVTDTHAAADEAAQMLLNMGRAELRDFVEQARKQEKKEAADNADVDPVIVLTNGAFESGNEVSFHTENGPAFGTIMGIDPDNPNRLVVNSQGDNVSVDPSEIEIYDDIPLSVVSAGSGLMQQKVDALQDALDKEGAVNTTVCTRENVIEICRQDGASKEALKKIRKLLDDTKREGNFLAGFYLNKKVYIIADDVDSFEEAKRAYIHESKHRENKRTRAHIESLKTGVTRAELRTALFNINGTHTYDGYRSSGLADEILAHCSALAEQFGIETLPEKLRDAGIKNEDFITFVKNNIEDGRRTNGERLDSERGAARLLEGKEGNSGQNGRDLQGSAEEVGEERSGASGGGQQAAQRGESEESEEVGPQPSVVSKESQELFEAAKQRFGITRDIREAGYVLPDGTMLDFSGRHSLAPGSDSSFLSGRRAIDHRDIEDLNFEPDLNTPSGRNTNMADFISRGAIRINYPGAINLATNPTPEQISVLSRLIERSDGDVWVDFGAGVTDHYVEYEGARPSRVINDINRYFEYGEKPESNVRFSVVNKKQSIFFSNAQAAVDRIKMDKATPEQWLKMLEKEGGLKAGEDKWMGLSDWLKASDKKTITKQEVSDYVEQHRIVIEEQPYSDAENMDFDGYFDWDNYLEGKYGPIATDAYFFMPDGNGGMNANVESSEKAVEFYNLHHPDTPLTPEEDEYGGISLTDEEYDVLLDFGEQIMKEVQDAEADFENHEGIRPINDVRRGYTTEGLENKREVALTVPTIEPWNERDEIHFGDAGGGRAVAWVRFGDTTIKTPVTEKELQEFKDSQARPDEYDSMTNANGRTVWFPFGNRMSKDFIVERDGRFTVYINEVAINTEGSLEEAVNSLNDHVASYRPNELATRFVLVIDEIQSKRHQEGRERGYREEAPADLPERIAYEKAEKEYDDYLDSLREKYGRTDISGVMTAEEGEKADSLFEARNLARLDYNNYLQEHKLGNFSEGVPSAPFEKNWHELAMKRMLRLAAEEGYDYVAWTTGEQQAERYSLKEYFGGIGIQGGAADSKYLWLHRPGKTEGGMYLHVSKDGTILNGSDRFKGERIENVLGKELAERILSTELEQGEKRELDNSALEIGGEGMKGFYDEILPRFMNKYGKKWGVKVEDINLPKLGSSDEFAASGMEGIKMHAVPITDEMREDVMEGQPMFSVVSSKKKIAQLDAAEKVTGYRTVVLNPDGSLNSPMAGGLSEARKNKGEAQSVRTSPFQFGVWEQSEENPHLADANGKIKLNKTDNANRGLVDVDAVDYNPYIHLRLDTINRQFKDAWKRPDLIYIKSEVPKSEVDGTNPYQAHKAVKSTGIHDWNGGKLMLSRYDKPIEQVSWDNVADAWAADKDFIEKGVKFDIVPPQILDNLAERGIRILPPSKGKDKNEAYKAWLAGDTEAYESWRDTGKAPEDGGVRDGIAAIDKMSTDKSLGAVTEKMGIPVKQVTASEMPKGHTTDKGYYNPSTGEVTVCMDNVTDERDAIATVLHESVGYRGLDGLLGSRIGNTLAQAYSRLGEEGRAYVNSVIARDGLNPGDEGIGRAVIEYLAGLAERKDYDNQEWYSAGDVLGEAVDSIIGTDGFSFTDNEQAYMLRAANEYLKNPDWLNTAEGRALDTLMKRELGINESDPDKPTDPDGIDSGVRFSVVKKTSDKASANFDMDMRSWRNKRRIEHQDAQHVARIALKRIMQEKNMKGYAEDADYLTRQNLASSRSATQAFEFTKQQYNPMLEAVNKIVLKLTEKLGRKVTKKDRSDAFQRVLDYIYGVSGLERNAYKNAELERKKQEELDAAREAAEKEREAASTDVSLASDKVKLDIRIKEIDDALAAKEDEITKRYDGKKRDWSGITSLMEMEPDDWERAEAFAQDFIDAFKDELGPEADALLNELWDRIRACTDYSLEHAYKYGLLTREEFERLHGTASRPRMWNYYVPLRGFKEKTAEEEYDYGYGSITNGGGVVEKAKGRWTEADNPLANIMNIALREIVQGNDNWAKQALLQFVLDAGENTLLSVRDPWFVKNESTGKWEPAEPIEDKAHGYTERIDEFEKRMNDLRNGIRADGTVSPTPLAKNGRKGLKLDMIMANKANQNSHIIRLKLHGIEQVIWVNGNAGLAKTVMGQGRAAENMKFFRSISRKLSNLFTTWSINFSIRNLIRDTRYSRRRLRVMEDRAYRHQYNKNWIKNSGYVGGLAIPMVALMYKWKEGVLFEKEKAGTLTDKERMFMDFMRDGCQTGYTVIQTVDSIKKDLEKAMEQARGGKSKVNIPVLRYVFEFIPTLNEGFELLTRFTAYQTSRDMGRSGQRAASDAKEISVNFNRRGAQSGEGFWGWTAAYLGATHYFYNASVQGFDNLAQLFKAKPINMTAKMADFAIMGIIIPFLNSALAGLASAMGHGGDDDDDWYWDLPEYVRRNFVVIGTPKGYLTLPLPPEFRAAYGLGDIVASLMNHKSTYDDGFQIGLDIMTQFAEVLPLNPVEGYNASSNQKWYEPVVRAVTPDILMFGVDALTNRDYTGRPLYKENPFSHTKPLSQGAYASTPKYLVDACMKLAEMTSDTALAPYFDWSPGIIRDAMKNFGGGPYKLFEDVLKIVDHDEERPSRWDNIPFFSGFTGHLDEDRRDSFEANALRYYKDNMESVVRRLNSAAGVNNLSPSDIFDPKKFEKLPEEVKSNVRFQKILGGEDYVLAETYWKEVRKKLSETSFHFDVTPKGNVSKTPKPDVERESLDKLRDTWKELRKQWHEMPNKTEEEKRAKKAFEETVQEAWHVYYNAEGDILDALMREEYDHVSQKIKNGIPYEPKPNLSERVFNAVKDLKK